MNVQNSTLARVVTLLEGVSDFHLAREQGSKKRKKDRRAAGNAESKKRQKLVGSDPEHNHEDSDKALASFPVPQETTGVGDDAHPPAPGILNHMVIGINEVTKRLESQARSAHQTVTISSSATTPELPKELSPLALVLVCQGDIDPPLLTAHLPPIVAACNVQRNKDVNGSRPGTSVKLIPLSKGSEDTLCAAIGLRRASVIAFDVRSPELSTCMSF